MNLTRDQRDPTLMKSASIVKAWRNYLKNRRKQTQKTSRRFKEERMGVTSLSLKECTHPWETVECFLAAGIRGILAKAWACNVREEAWEEVNIAQWNSLAWEKIHQKEEEENSWDASSFVESFSWI